MIGSLPSHAIAAVALAAGLLLAGCSSDSDVPATVASAPGGGTQANTDTGSGGEFPDVNTVPTQRPTSTIQDLNLAPEGLSGAPSGTQYGEPLIGGPSSAAEPPAPPPPPEPALEEQLPPIPETSVETQGAEAPGTPTPEATVAEAPAIEEAPEVEEPPAFEEAPVVEETPVVEEELVIEEEPVVEEALVEPEPIEAPEVAEPELPQPEEQIAGTDPAPEPEFPAADGESAPAAPLAPMAEQQQGSPSLQQGAQLATAPEAYGASSPAPARPYSYGGANYGGANYGTAVVSSQSAATAPATANYGQPIPAGQPVGLIYFRDGSSKLSSDDLLVLGQVAEMQRTYGGIVRIVGHASIGAADSERRRQANQRISEARANAVAQQLMEYGVPLTAIQAAAAGDSQPLYSEAMPNGEAANRRAEVYLSAY